MQKKTASYAGAAMILILAVVVISGCIGQEENPGTDTVPVTIDGEPFTLEKVTLSGAGATFPAPLYQKWSEEFFQMTGVQVNYEGIGSGGGIKQHTEKTVHFGGTDPPMNDDEFETAPGSMHIPTCIGSVAVVYNIPGVPTGLNLRGSVIADIFQLKVTKWNDPAIASDNPGVSLPDATILVAHRTESSGTTKLFSNFLADNNEDWKNNYGVGKVIDWPTDTLGGKGNPGVAALVQQNEKSIGYVSLAYAIENDIPFANVWNGKTFVAPSTETVAEAAAAFSTALPKGDESWSSVGDYFNLNTLDDPGNGYPISALTYIIIYKEWNVLPEMDEKKALALMLFLWWAVHEDGQAFAEPLSYVSIPDEMIKLNEGTLKMVTFNGELVHNWG